MNRREFITLLGGAAAWPLAARAQQAAMPVVGFVNAGSSDAPLDAAFRKGLNEAGYFEGQNVTVEYHWLEGQFDRLPALMADLVRRRVAVIATPAGNYAAQVAKAETAAIPIVFGVGDDPVKLGLVTSLARPGGNLTGVNFFANELSAKRLALLHELLPKAVRVAVLVNPANPASESTLPDLLEAARAMGLQIQVLKASTRSEIEAAFTSLVRDRAEALYVAGDVFFTSRRVQLVTLAAINRIPASYPSREAVEAGGLMGYDADRAGMYRQVGTYTGQILKGAKPSDLPVLQSKKFEFVINMQTARALGIEVSNSIQLLADAGGIGSGNHIFGELFKMIAGVDLVHVPYRGAGPAVADLLGGQAQVMFASTSSSIEYVRAGKLRALAVTTAMRSPVLPDIPTVAEFLPGYESSFWYGIAAPKNTPAKIADKLNQEINTAIADPKMKARLAEWGTTLLAGSPAEFGKLLAEETEKWGKVIRAANIKAE